MAEKRDKLLSDAGGLLIAAGAVAAFAGGSYGLESQRPGVIIWTILLLMGYGVVGYLLMDRGARAFHIALPAAAVLVVGTLFLFETGMRSFVAGELFRFVLQPFLVVLLVFAAGALATHVVEETTARVAWAARGAGSLYVLLHLAAVAPVWSAFVLLELLGGRAAAALSVLVIGASAAAGIAAIVGAHAPRRSNHPGWTLLGAGAAFAASAAYLFQFMAGMRGDAVYFGQLLALLGLIFSSIPAAMGVVAWIQVNQTPPVAEDGEAQGPGDGMPEKAL